jgi:hypothetical protein
VLAVGDNASLDLALASGAVGMERISVVANANRLDVKTPGGRHEHLAAADPEPAAGDAQLPRVRGPGARRELRHGRQHRPGEGAERRPEPGQREPLHRRRGAEELHPARRHLGPGFDPRQPVPAVGRVRIQGDHAELQGGVRPGVAAPRSRRSPRAAPTSSTARRSGTTPRPTGPRRTRSRRRHPSRASSAPTRSSSSSGSTRAARS